MSTEPQVVVSQADRDAAAAYMRDSRIGTAATYARYRLGDADNSNIVQAFARHAASARQSSGVGEDVEARAEYLQEQAARLRAARDGMEALSPSTFAMGVEAAAKVADQEYRRCQPDPNLCREDAAPGHTAQRVARRIAAAIRALSPPSDSLDGMREAHDALAWLATDTRLELSHHCPTYGDDDDQAREWRVHRVSGSINDREWDKVGAGETPLAAIIAARQALHPGAKEGGA